jgi:hypothetical protein
MEIDTGRYIVLAEAEQAATLAQKIGRKLKPPTSDDPIVNAWRWFIVVTVTANSVALVVHILLACGLTPFFAGFAHASDQKADQRVNLVSRLEQLDWRMFDLRVKQCEAIKKQESPRVFTWQLDQLVKVYYDLTTRYPQLPSCEQIN